MLQKLRKCTRGQNTAEYAILLAMVISVFITMQTWVKRGVQARIRDASLCMTQSGFGTSTQFEPDYLLSNFWVERTSAMDTKLTAAVGGSPGTSSTNGTANITRFGGGYQEFLYRGTATLGNGGELTYPPIIDPNIYNIN